MIVRKFEREKNNQMKISFLFYFFKLMQQKMAITITKQQENGIYKMKKNKTKKQAHKSECLIYVLCMMYLKKRRNECVSR